jgi:hypothetical protein
MNNSPVSTYPSVRAASPFHLPSRRLGVTVRAFGSASPWHFVTLAGLLFLLWLRFHQPHNTVDDAYITFRYARNVVNGVGFVYNAGERVLGTTTPAYTLLLALASRLGNFYNYPCLALFVNTLCDAVSFTLLIRLFYRLTGRRWAGLGVALLLAIDGRLLDFGTGGMESCFNVLAILLTLTLFFEKRSLAAAAAAGLAFLIRPDGATLVVAIFLGFIAANFTLSPSEPLARRHRPSLWLGVTLSRLSRCLPWKELGVFLAVVLPWLVFATLYFGQPIPQSVLAKSVSYHTPSLMAFRAFLVQLRTVFPFSLPPLHDPEPIERQLLQALLPLGLAVFGLVTLHARQKQAWIIGVYIALFILFFSVGNPLWLGWYEVPLMPLYELLILAACLWVGERLSRVIRPLSLTWLFALGAVGVMAVPQLSRLNTLPWEKPRQAAWVLNATYNKQRETDYDLFGRMLAPAGAQGRLAANPEIGAFGYAYSGPVFDVTGLISPLMLRYFPLSAGDLRPDMPMEIYSVPPRWLFEQRPDLFVSFDGFIQATLDPYDPQFLAVYTPTLGLTSHAAFGIQRLVAYRRADLSPSSTVTLPVEAIPADIRYSSALLPSSPTSLLLRGYTTRFWADDENNFLEATLYWQNGAATIDRELLVRVNLLSADGQQVYQVLDYPGEGLFHTPTWGPGMILVDRYQLKRPVPDVDLYTVTVTVFDDLTGDVITAQIADGGALVDNTFVIPVTK